MCSSFSHPSSPSRQAANTWDELLMRSGSPAIRTPINLLIDDGSAAKHRM